MSTERMCDALGWLTTASTPNLITALSDAATPLELITRAALVARRAPVSSDQT
eukprot:CAMPEP_0183359134 /NCGR_PEP_ID=MMETSP0164_2-20130417/51305_1 /TAXON_ID=221442 /ORGANISM="Coccolithus pelagicus ssp braarudi, Strain PLY182g" /LENGTH=52 /DNA_ID=CAMNT_0025533183 /DNA_START=133 /DNA_END=287 /DNA_ORIENTATION=-